MSLGPDLLVLLLTPFSACTSGVTLAVPLSACLSPPFPPSVPFHHSFSYAIPLLISSSQACVPFSTFPHNTNTKKILHLCLLLTAPCLLPAACTLELRSPPVTVHAIHACARPLPEAQKGP